MNILDEMRDQLAPKECFLFSTKKGIKTNLWQIKNETNHGRFALGIHAQFEDLLSHVGIDPHSTDNIYMLKITNYPFTGYHLKMERIGNSLLYKIIESSVGSQLGSGDIHEEIVKKFQDSSVLYLSVEKKDSEGVLFARKG